MSARVPDTNGWYEIPDNPLSRVGVFEYSGASIGAPDPNKLYKVYRPEEELNNPATLNSFRLVPLIDNHRMLGKATNNSIPAEQYGIQGTIGDNVRYDSKDRMIKGNLKVWSDSQQKKIDAGKVDLSLGYLCEYQASPGVFEGQAYEYVQRNLRGNHVANVDAGRMGDAVSVMDGITATFDQKDFVMATPSKWVAAKKKQLAAFNKLRSEKDAAKRKVYRTAMDAAGEEAESAGEPTLSDVAEILSDVLPQIADINEAMAGASMGGGPDDMMEPELDEAGNPVMDAAGKPKMKAKVAPAKAAEPATAEPVVAGDKAKGMDKAAMDAAIKQATAPLLAEIEKLKKNDPTKATVTEIARRNEMAGKLSHFVGSFDHAEMTLLDVAKYGVDKLKIPTMDGQEISSVTAWLHGREPSKPAFAMDSGKSGGEPSSVDKFLSGAKAA